MAVAIWAIKRRMRRKMEELAAAVGERLRARHDLAGDAGHARPGSIDAEGRVVRRPRDGADAPHDGLDHPGPR